MAKPPRPWIVTPHSEIEKLEDNLWAVTSLVPGAPIHRRMCIIKLSDGRLLFWHAIPIDEKTLAEITAWGKPAILVVAHDNHMIDAHAFASKLGLKVYGPKSSEAKVRARIDLAGTFEDLKLDASVSVESIPGTKSGEPLVVVRSADGQRVSLLFADVIQNNNRAATPFFFRMLGFAGGPKVVAAFKTLFVKDKNVLRAELDKMANTPKLARIIPFHGDIVATDPAGALRSARSAV